MLSFIPLNYLVIFLYYSGILSDLSFFNFSIALHSFSISNVFMSKLLLETGILLLVTYQYVFLSFTFYI